jgi:hypothetical protein
MAIMVSDRPGQPKGGGIMEEEMEFQRGVISGIAGHPMSGLWSLVFEDGSLVHIGSGMGVRALASAFGATEGSGDLEFKIIGQEIVYSTDFMGVMEGFTPIDEWEGD